EVPTGWPNAIAPPLTLTIDLSKLSSFSTAIYCAAKASLISNKSISSIVRLARFKACRSEEHTSELQSRFDLVCRLLLEKKIKGSVPKGDMKEIIQGSLSFIVADIVDIVQLIIFSKIIPFLSSLMDL